MKRLILCIVLLTALLGVNAQQTALGSEITELVRQMNLWRITQGLGPLTYNPTLERMAVYQADYILRLPSLPQDIHAGPDGEDPRARSQLSQFNWATYGHPELMSVTEIAAIGSVRTAIEFWQNSDIHNRSVTNPTYREIGVAAYEYGTDILFVAVLGGQPNVLPVLLDVENKQLYLTTEKVEWTGDWVGDVTEYRYLDADKQPLSEWAEWERIIDISDEMLEEAIYIEFVDLNDHRTDFELIFNPIWSQLELIAGLAQPTETSEARDDENDTNADEETDEDGTSSVFATNTPVLTPTTVPSPIPTLTPFPTSTPTPTPLPKSLVFTYTDQLFVLYNNGSQAIDLSDSMFQRDDISFRSSFWEEVADNLNISALPSGHCLLVQPENDLTYVAPSECVSVRGIVQEPDPRYFWLGDFEMLINGEVVATCVGELGLCEVVIP